MEQLIWVTVPAFFAGLIQGVTGFGAGVFLILFYPSFFGVALSSAMCQCLSVSLCIALVIQYRRYVHYKVCLLPLLFYFPSYFLALSAAIRLDTDRLKPVLGIFLIVLSAYFTLFSDKIHIQANVRSAFVCAALGGIVDAFFGIGGPTIVIYFMAAVKDKKEYLGTIQAFFMTTCAYATAVRAVRGQIPVEIAPLLAMGMVTMVLGSFVSKAIVNRIDVQRMKQLVYGFIGVAGLITILTSL